MAGTDSSPSLLHRSFLETPHKVVKGEGSYLHLEDGRLILDACGGAAVSILGHGNEEVTQAMIDQARRVSYVHTGAYTTDSAEDLAKYILEPFNSNFDHGLVKAFFVGSGSEANDTAMKCARQYWVERGQTSRTIFVCRRMNYHGNTIGAMSVSGVVARKATYLDICLPNVSQVSPADYFHGKLGEETEEEFTKRLLKELEDEFMRLGPQNIISFM